MIYFSYGSNMCTGRLRVRVPSANPSFAAKLANYRLRFHKRSADGSGKANAYYTGDVNDSVWGVVFQISEEEKPELDRAEGLGSGYDERPVTVIDTQGQAHEVFTYTASSNAIDENLRPYGWYKRFVKEGAKQHRLPEDYLRTIEAQEEIVDPDRERDARKRRITC
ncbi:MAG: gamma-glutamylcyclotransferase [Acidobacteria bacterium]|nr:gamma-glutamylcyclotransferase [Acidobacteriota bacterium]